MNNRILTIGGLVLMIAAAIGGAFYILTRDGAASGPTKTVEEVLALTDDDIGMGDPNAPIKLIEYASTGCPHCAAMAAETIPKLKQAYIDKGQVYYVLRDFPLDNVALAGSLIARCVPKDQFYAFMDILFQNQELWHSPTVADPKEGLVALAKRAGLSREQVDACLKDQKVLDRINQSLNDAVDVLKVDGTPTLYFNGEKVGHGLSFEDMDVKLKEIQAKMK